VYAGWPVGAHRRRPDAGLLEAAVFTTCLAMHPLKVCLLRLHAHSPCYDTVHEADRGFAKSGKSTRIRPNTPERKRPLKAEAKEPKGFVYVIVKEPTRPCLISSTSLHCKRFGFRVLGLVSGSGLSPKHET
jgi:hypothetical protein